VIPGQPDPLLELRVSLGDIASGQVGADDLADFFLQAQAGQGFLGPSRSFIGGGLVETRKSCGKRYQN
jgi:hypothetical protein